MSLYGTRCKEEPDVKGDSVGGPDVRRDSDVDSGVRGTLMGTMILWGNMMGVPDVKRDSDGGALFKGGL